MKIATLLFFIIVLLGLEARAGLPPTSLKGQSDTSAKTTFFFQAPNSQATEVAPSTGLIETGNTNILVNPSFEHSTFNTGWTCTGITPIAETTVKVDGKKAMVLAASASTFECYQDSSTNAAYSEAVNFIAQMFVKGTWTGTSLKLCARLNGTTSTTLCRDITSNDYYFPWDIANFPANSSSNGISIAGVNVTGNIYLDKAKVGINETNKVPTCDGSVDCTTHFTAIVTTGTVSNENVDWINGNCTNPSTGNYTCTYNTNIFTVTPSCKVTGIAAEGSSISAVSSSVVSPQLRNSVGTLQNGSFHISCSKTGADYTKAKAVTTGFSSRNADYSRRQYTPTFTALGTSPANDCYHSRQGQFMYIDCTFTMAATPAGSEARISLPDSKVISSTGSARLCGDMGKNSFGSTYFRNAIICEPSMSYITLGTQTNGTSAINKALGTQLGSAGEVFNFTAKIPIQGWETSNVMIASVKDMVTSIGSTTGADIQSVLFGSGGDCTTVCSTGTCVICHQVGTKITSVTFVSTGRYRLNGIDGTKYHCAGSGASGNFISGNYRRDLSTSTYGVIGYGDNTGALNANQSVAVCTGDVQ